MSLNRPSSDESEREREKKELVYVERYRATLDFKT